MNTDAEDYVLTIDGKDWGYFSRAELVEMGYNPDGPNVRRAESVWGR